jgi:hypothetical protein
MKFALVRGGVVTNVIAADQQFIDDHPELYEFSVDIGEKVVNVGDNYDQNTQTFSASTANLQAMAANILARYQVCGANIVNALYVNAALSGNLPSQNDAALELLHPVIFRLREGALGAALFNLSTIDPAGIVTSTVINNLKAAIMASL